MPGKTNENGTSQESKDLVVFDIVRDSECAECRRELLAHDFLFMEDGHPLCLTCADLDHLAYLPRDDTALTRRARKYSSLQRWWFGSAESASAMNARVYWSRKLPWSEPRKNVMPMSVSDWPTAIRHRCVEWHRIAISCSA